MVERKKTIHFIPVVNYQMKIEIPIKEVEEFLSNYYHINVSLKSFEGNKIKATYFVALVLSIKKDDDDEITFHYEANVFANFIIKCAHLFLKKKIYNLPLVWNSMTREVAIDLKKIQALSEFLKYMHITELHFVNKNILLVLSAKSN